MAHEINEKDRFKTKTWIIPLPKFKFHHKSYEEKIDHRSFFGRDQQVKDFVEVLRNSHSTSGSYLVTGYRGAGKTSFIKKVMDILSNGYPSITSYNNPIARLLAKFINKIIDRFPRFSDFISNINISTNLIIAFALIYILFIPFGWWDILALPVLVLLYYFKLYGFAALNPVAWVRWILHPVVQVPINLGHDIKNPKNVIFSLITLLRDKYIETVEGNFKQFKLSKLIGIFILILFSFILTILTWNLFNGFHSYIEEKTKILIFEGTDLKKFDNENDEKNNNNKSNQDYCLNKKILNKNVHLTNIGSQDTWNIKISKEIQDQLKITGSNKDDNSLLVIEKHPTESGSPSAIREYIFVPIYCSIHYLSQDFYDFYHKNDNQNKTYDFAFLTRLSYIFFKFENGLFYLEENNKPQVATPYQVLLFFLILSILISFRQLFSPTKRIIRRLDELHKRIQASDMIENKSFFDKTFSFFNRRKYQLFQTLDERQAENLLLQVLEENNNNFFIQPHIIFLFDELDKIDPPEEKLRVGEVSPVEVGLSESIRQRQQEIEKLLASLKNLITTASCNSIFAAGREMLDANLADRGEIRFLHGSLFDRIFYISSFLTDTSDTNSSDISSMIEQYVCRRLMSPVCARASYASLMKEKLDTEVNSYEYWSLKVYMEYLKNLKVKDSDRFRLLSFLQYFVYFLSYRSGGNTKKLDLYFEEFVKPFPEKYFSNSDNYHHIPQFALKKNELVLYFNFKEQYRVQLIANFFTIFHGSYSKLIRQYGDKLSLSVFSILDYICKFHSMSFSRTELERMPGALDIHRAPALPQIIEMLLDRILSPYLNKINNGLYHFHFSRNIQREILYISQFNEQEMAAFNFSLDESIQIKQHYRQILNEQIKLYKAENFEIKEVQGNNVLSNLHIVLGDLHAQDNEFDQALTEYLHAAYHLKKNVFTEQSDNVTPPIIIYIEVLLKIGLLQERRMLYDVAIATYYRAMQTIEKHLKESCFFKENFEQLKILLQPYLCLSFLHAKQDHNLDTANNFMTKAVNLIKQDLTPEFTNQNFFISQHYIHWAQMFMMRSEFERAIWKYICALKEKCSFESEENINYSDIGEILAGLSYACTALALYKWYKNKEFSINFPPDKYHINYDPKSINDLQCGYEKNLNENQLKHYLCKNVKLIIKLLDSDQEIEQLIQKALHLYVLSSHAYRLSASPDDESFILWKLAYVVGYGLNYIDMFDHADLKNTQNIDWLFNNLNKNHYDNPIRKGFAQIFGGSYSVHKRHLKKEIGVKDDKVIRWITPPLTQVLLVLGHFWRSYWSYGVDAKMDETAFEIVDMGAFPMKAKILALYLKARWYQNRANNKAQAFILYTQVIPNIQAYECGLDYISLPLGMVYYHIWEILKEDAISGGKILASIRDHEDFQGNMQRYFSIPHCRNKTKKYLIELLSRHHINGINPQRFFTYMNKQYYLYNAFSSDYANGMWALEYGLVPVAKEMLKRIEEE